MSEPRTGRAPENNARAVAHPVRRPHKGWCSALVTGCDCGVESTAREQAATEARRELLAALMDTSLIVEFDGLDPETILIRRAAVLRLIEESDRG